LKTTKLSYMKRIFKITILALSVVLITSAKNTASAQVGVDVSISYQSFYDELSPHGRWIDYPEYGYVWAPNMGPEFQPYSTGGQWVWSDEYDWMWVSDYSWGWAPFHYGRWFHDDYYGWMWMPGYEWSPGWVSWRTGGDYYGWAPLRPGISISIGFGNYNPPSNYWCFAPRRYINHRNIGNYCEDRGRNITIINNTTIINNYGNRNNVFVNGGPGRRDAERYTGRIRSVNFRETDRPGGREFRNNRLSVYRPQIQRDNDRRIAPRNFDRYNRDGRNNGNSIRRNENNQPDQRQGNNNRVFGRRDNDTRQPGNNNDIANRRRNVFDRDNNRVGTRESNRPNDQRPQATDRPANGRNVFDRNRNNDRSNQQREVTTDRPIERRNVFDRNRNDNRASQQRQITTDRPIERRNVFDRNRNNDRPGTQLPVDDSRRERPDIIRRNENRPSNNEQRTFENRNRNMQQNDRRNERREVFERNNNSTRQPDRREIRNENRPQQQAQPQTDRQPQREPSQFENRGNDQRNSEQRGDNNGGGRGRAGRRVG
jgi:hypothetical protein